MPMTTLLCRQSRIPQGGQRDTSAIGDPLERVAALLQRRSAIDADLAAIMQPPMSLQRRQEQTDGRPAARRRSVRSSSARISVLHGGR